MEINTVPSSRFVSVASAYTEQSLVVGFPEEQVLGAIIRNTFISTKVQYKFCGSVTFSKQISFGLRRRRSYEKMNYEVSKE